MLDKILEVESDKRILNFQFSYENILMWPFVRWDVFFHVLKQKLHLELESPSKGFSFKDNLKYVWNTLRYDPFLFKDKKIIIFGEALDNGERIDGKYFNRMHDYFGLEFEDETIIVENSFQRTYREPRYFKNVAYHDLLKIKVELISKVLKTENEDIKRIENLLSFIKETFPREFEDSACDEIRLDLLRLAKKLRPMHYYYKKLFKRLKPQIMFLNCASYGGRSYILKWAKDMGIKTGEIQHGIMTKGSIPYNYGDIIFKSERYKEYLPDYLLTFGEFWNESIRTPSHKITIGYPHYNSVTSRYNKVQEHCKDKNKILVVSQWLIRQELINLTVEISKVNKNEKYEIIFRPHPTHKLTVLEKELLVNNNITIAETEIDSGIGQDEDVIYNLIFKSDYIVGCYSATLFEALGLNKPIFIYKNKASDYYIPENIGFRFKNAEDLLILLNNYELKNYNINSNYYWAKNWKDNYREFINGTDSI